MRWPPSRNRLLLSRSHQDYDRAAVAPPGSLLRFDHSSGQMYTETIISTQSTEERDWTKPRCMSLKFFKKQPRPVNGTRSLIDSAINIILENLLDLTFEGVECLPKELVLQIWRLAHERYVIPFCVWTIFSKVLRDKNNIPLSLLRYRHIIPSPRMSLQTYTATLTSFNIAFLASLSLTTTFPVPQLVKLSSLNNLGILEIVHNSKDGAKSAVSDRLIRAWHQAALDEEAFSVLRILKLWNHKGVTETSLNYLNSFPVLALFDVRGCTFDTKSPALARTLGWRSTVDVCILSLFEAMCRGRAFDKRAFVEQHHKQIRRAPSHQLDEDNIVTRIPRADVAELIPSPTSSVSKLTATAISHWDGWQRMGDLPEKLYPDKSFKEVRRGTNQHLQNTSYLPETWDFRTSTIFSKIGEFRSDQDLDSAGVHLGEIAIVDDELVNSVPLVALRLGPFLEELKPSFFTNTIESFYESAGTEHSGSHLSEVTRDYPKNVHPALVDIKPALIPDLGSLGFYRINAPVPKSDSSSSSRLTKDGMIKSDKGRLEDSMNLKRRPFADHSKRHNNFMQNKKQKLDDVLGSFM